MIFNNAVVNDRVVTSLVSHPNFITEHHRFFCDPYIPNPVDQITILGAEYGAYNDNI